MTQVGGREECT